MVTEQTSTRFLLSTKKDGQLPHEMKEENFKMILTAIPDHVSMNNFNSTEFL